MTHPCAIDTGEALSKPVADLVSKLDLRANSLLITIFGDAIVPRGGNIWLGSLIDLAAPFGVSERLVRTGVYRLAQEGWLQSQSRGRRAYYTLTRSGEIKFAAADRRIYSAAAPTWNDEWLLVQMLGHIGQNDRQALRRELGWLGFGQLNPTLIAHPTLSERALEDALAGQDMTDGVLVFRATIADFVKPDTLNAVIQSAWRLDELNTEYDRFLNTFNAISQNPDSVSQLTSRECFVLRVVLIHDYRRILLKDPLLPTPLLPQDWKGDVARDLCQRIYAHVRQHADDHLTSTMQTLNGDLPNPLSEYAQRFAMPV